MKAPTCLACYRLSRQCGGKATCARCVARAIRRQKKTPPVAKTKATEPR